MKKFDKERVLLAVAGPVIALVAAFALTVGRAARLGQEPVRAYTLMFDRLDDPTSRSDHQPGSMYYMAALAVAIGFRMNLFNIGVDGQYRLAAMIAAVVGGASPAGRPPDPAAHPGRHAGRRLLGRHRGRPQGHPRGQRGRRDDHAQRDRDRVIGYLLLRGPARRQGRQQQHHRPRCRVRLVPRHPTIGADRRDLRPGLPRRRSSGIVYWVVLNRTRFGFDLRATGASRVGRRGQRRRRQADGPHRHADLRRGRRAWPACRCCSATSTPTASTSPPASASPASPSPCSAATTRSASRFAALLWAFLDAAAQTSSTSTAYDEGDRGDHAGPDRAVRSSSPTRPYAVGAAPPAAARSAPNWPPGPSAAPTPTEGGGG